MFGTANSDEFLLSTATLMMGPAEDLMDFDPDTHSLGLVKNVRVSEDKQYTDLQQGVANTTVASVNTSASSTLSAEVYEFTKRNLAYALGLAATSTMYDSSDTIYNVASAPTGVTVELSASNGANFAAGETILIQDPVKRDRVHVAKIESIATDTLTLDADYTIPTSVVFGTDARVFKSTPLAIGKAATNKPLAIKLVGVLPESEKPITIVFPKVRVTRGFEVGFSSQDFSNMPFEFMPLDQVNADPWYGKIDGQGQILSI